MTCRYRFDDEHVTKEDMRKALDELYGGEEEVCLFTLFSFLNRLLCFACSFSYTVISSQHLMQITPGIINAPFKFTKNSNAYMLVYVRESDKDKIMCSVDEKDIAEHLRVSYQY